MRILFTKSGKIGSRLIRLVTGEPISHCAVYSDDGYILHSTFTGPVLETFEEFTGKNTIVYSVKVADIPLDVRNYRGAGYDYTAFFWLALRYLMPDYVKKQDIRQLSGAYLCTELVTDILIDEEKLLTPYQLYNSLIKKELIK